MFYAGRVESLRPSIPSHLRQVYVNVYLHSRGIFICRGHGVSPSWCRFPSSFSSCRSPQWGWGVCTLNPSPAWHVFIHSFILISLLYRRERGASPSDCLCTLRAVSSKKKTASSAGGMGRLHPGVASRPPSHLAEASSGVGGAAHRTTPRRSMYRERVRRAFHDKVAAGV